MISGVLTMSVRGKVFPIVMTVGLLAALSFMHGARSVFAFDFGDAAAVGAAYTTHLFLHEVGHQVVADYVGADASHMSFFTKKDGRFYPGISTYKSIPEESKLPYAFGGERMAGYTFEYALQSYRHKSTTFNKALMFFSCADFVVYTFLANYISADNNTYDPNLIRQETGWSKELMLSLVMAKSVMNTYRIFNEDTNYAPIIWVDKKSAALLLRFSF